MVEELNPCVARGEKKGKDKKKGNARTENATLLLKGHPRLFEKKGSTTAKKRKGSFSREGEQKGPEGK